MPGKYSHDITVKANIQGLNNIKIPNSPLFRPLFTALRRQFREGRKQFKQNLDLVVGVLAPFSLLKQRAKLSEKGSIITGTLYKSIQITRRSRYRASIGTSLFYVEYVEEGRGPVRAKRKKCLAFKIPGHGWVFTKSVGPAKPRYYLKESSALLEPEIEDIMTTVMESYGDVFT